MKIRLISDLHRCINRKYPLTLRKDMCDYTLIAGDMGPDFKDNEKWLRENLTKGAFISGNHDAYTHDNTPLEDVKSFYHEKFPLESDITYFDSDVGVISKEIGENTLLIADVMYTDYKLITMKDMKNLPVVQRIARNMHLATPKMHGSYMNDFNFFTRKGTYEKKDSIYDRSPEGMFYLRPENYKEHFDRTFKLIDNLVKENADKDIILMTHHCLSKKCIANDYNNDTLNASYISDKDAWIRKHPNIKLILSGHVHHRNSFNVGKTLYVLNPLGYIREYQHMQWDKALKAYVPWTPDCIVDTKDWSLTYTEQNFDDWKKTEKEETKRLESLMGCFI